MSGFKRIKWSVIAVAILLLLALHRSQVNKQQASEVKRQPPAVHELSEPGFSALPGSAVADIKRADPVQDFSEELSAQAEELSAQTGEIKRFSIATDGGDFQPNRANDQPVCDPVLEAENVEPDANRFASATSSPTLDQSTVDTFSVIKSSEPEMVASRVSETANPVLRNLQQNDGFIQNPTVEVQSVPDFEPMFATTPRNAKINLPRGVLVKVVNHIEYGKSLARRGAVFGARQEFLAALKLVAQSIDQMRGGDSCSNALFEANRALRESDDFYQAQAEQHRRVDVVAVAKGHQSNVVEPDYLQGLNPMQAMQLYYDFVQGRLVECGGGTVVAGEALYCLGKLHQVRAKDPIEGSVVDNAKSVVFYNASVNCDPNAYKSANELGVMLARSDRLAEARNMFLRSLKTHQVSMVWANLANVHRRLGENHLADLADAEYRRMLEGPAANRIKWMEPEEFAQSQKDPLPLRTADAHNTDVDRAEAKKKSTGGLRNMMKKLF